MTAGRDPGAPSWSGRRARVLVVEDNPADARLAVINLRDSGVVSDCSVVSRIGDVDATGLTTFDCALIDLGLPDASGLDAVHRMRDLAPALPIVVLTGLDDEATGIEALRYGAQDYLVKGHADSYALGRSVRYAVERQRLQQQLEHQALHDALTGLPNRLLFVDRVDQALGYLHRGSGTVAVLYVDLDQFKAVNDSLGHTAGDELLLGAADRFTRLLRPVDTLARLGGDEFSVLCEDVRDPADVELVADRLRSALETPFVLQGRTVRATASIGVTVARPETVDAMTLLRDADTALYAAKEAGRDRVMWFDEELHARAMDRLTVLNDVREGLSRGRLRVAYQPVVDLRGGETVAYEALVRWQHPSRGLLRPDDFAPALADGPLVLAIDQFVLDVALTDLARWRQIDGNLHVSVNVSGATVSDREFVSTVLDALAAHGLPASVLTLEVLESAVVSPSAVDALAQLRVAGVRLALDDFGVGTSSLTHFLTVTADVIKLDAALVSAATTDHRARVLVELVARAAGEVGMPVVAEGVETTAELQLVRELGVPLAQGYLWAEPTLSTDGPPSCSVLA